MNFGFPCDLTLYKLGTDWGGLIGGFAAFIAGFLAYIAGVKQASATRIASESQIRAISDQHNEEIKNVRFAIRIEVITYSKYVIASFDTCEMIFLGKKNIPRCDANYIVKTLYESVIYPAVADRIGLLKNPSLIVEFYMRIEEAKKFANALAAKTDPASAVFTSAPVPYVTASDVEVIANSLITALQLAQSIISENDNQDITSSMDSYIKNHTLENIKNSLSSAKEIFPNAESFKIPMPRQ